MRKLKFHEKKLLKKVNFLEWKREGGHREAQVMRRYHVTGRDDYKKYNPLIYPPFISACPLCCARAAFRSDFAAKILGLIRIWRWFCCGWWRGKRYSSLCRMVQKLVNILKQMDPRDPFRVEMTDSLLEKL